METLENGILPLVMGGMGNQMFIISAAYVAHKTAKCPLYLLQPVSSKNSHNKKNRNYNKTLFKHFGIHIPYTANAIHFIESLNYRRLHPGGFDVWYPQQIQPGTIMSSYFQYYPALKPQENDLRQMYLKGLIDFSSKNSDYSDCALLHVRRGDYLEISNYRLLTVEYYKEAVKFLSKVQRIIIISNDIPWVKEQDYFNNPIFEFFISDDELETMALMSKCTAGAICANSTYSWWGAFLGAYGARNPVIVPKSWFFKDDVSADLFPEEWITV